jgi:hypothetical protein
MKTRSWKIGNIFECVKKNELHCSTKTNAGPFKNKIPQPVEYALGV